MQGELFAAAPKQATSVVGTADIEGPYRYSLSRTWDANLGRVCWVMLNPSTADADDDDRTIGRCIGFATSWGLGDLVVVNLFALISTDPSALVGTEDPVGPRNDASILAAVGRSKLVVCAWGIPPKKVRERVDAVGRLLDGVETHALRLTKDGGPWHPLYLKGSLKPFAWRPPGSRPA